MIQVPRAHDDEVVEALDLDALDQPLDMGVQVRRAVRKPCRGDAAFAKDAVERAVPGPELAVEISKQQPGPDHVSGHRGNKPTYRTGQPRCVRYRRRIRDVRPPGLGMHEHQVERKPQAAGCQDPGHHEVAGPERPGVRLEELRPAFLAARRPGRNTGLFEDVDHRRKRHAFDPQLLELAQDADVAEAGLLRDSRRLRWRRAFVRTRAGQRGLVWRPM